MGVPYRFQIKAINALGDGPYSTESFSYSTSSTAPKPPTQPIVEERTFSSVRYSWEQPVDCGSAITAYAVFQESVRTDIILARTQLSWVSDFLLPGELCRIKVKAKNVIGWSEYSPWSDDESRTHTQKPEQPSILQVMNATWNSMLLEGYLPYDNGSKITSMFVQYRIIEAFSKGSWQASLLYQIPNDITIVKYIDINEIMKLKQLNDRKIRSGINFNGDYDPFDSRKQSGISGPGSVVQNKIENKNMDTDIGDGDGTADVMKQDVSTNKNMKLTMIYK